MKETTHNNWWRGAVIYQIYPRSYQDDNGDGIGDIAGITRRLPHIANLGADAIWLSPFFTSPMKDFGYDVADYCDVDPMFGTLDNFKEMVETAHANGLKVMIDLVLSHTSDQHPWFTQSRQDKINDKADWYVWAEPKPDGTPPNNWLSIFGGSAWHWDTRREQYYLHNFLVEQPDLNFHNPDVQAALLDVAKFWLELGVDGFRLDTVNFYMHDKYLRDNPPLPKSQRNSSIAPSVNPYNHQIHLFSKNQPENMTFLADLRKLLNQYPNTTTVGEVGDAQNGLEIAAEYTAGDKHLHMCYAFELLTSNRPSAERIAEVLNAEKRINTDGWTCWALSNHDVIRHATRWCTSADGKFNDTLYRCFMALQLSFRGSVCLYQGEELGLGEADVAFEDLQDPYGIEFWPEFKGRDGCRTPMVWQTKEKNGGFSTAKTWLPVAKAHLSLAADTQVGKDDSIFSAYQQFLSFRKQHDTLINGTISNITADADIVHFERQADSKRLFCAFNLGDTEQTISLPGKVTALDGHGFSARENNGQLTLPAGQAYFSIFN